MAHSSGLRSTSVFRSIIAVAGAGALLMTASAPATVAQDDEPLNVVASFSVLADIVEQVGGDRVEVTSLVPVGGDAHIFDPAPDQITTLADADLIVQVGGDFEPWLTGVIEASDTSATVVEMFPESVAHGDEPAHDDLHAWLDVHTTVHAVEDLAATMTEIDPDNADAYGANADVYIAELEELDAYIIEQTETLPEDRRQLITTHQALDAFADAYGYEIAGVLLESHSTEGADAPASHVAELAGIIQDNDIPAVFSDTPGGEEMLQPLADEAGIEVAPSLYVDTLGEEGSGAESYIAMMRHNVDTIVAALEE